MELTQLQRLMAAVYMVGNMDTAEDKKRWWHDYQQLWYEVAKDPNVQSWADAIADEADAQRNG